ncbi:MAG: transposase [Pirellulales bacterium]
MLDGLSRGRELGLFDLWAYVIVPEHVHLVLWPHRGVGVSTILKSIKQSVAMRAIRWLEQNDPSYLIKLVELRPNGNYSHRFWQRGGGYDRNLQTVGDVHEKIAYVHNNPVRRGLVDKPSQWRWSSSSAWQTGVDEPIAIDRDSLPVKIEVVS